MNDDKEEVLIEQAKEDYKEDRIDEAEYEERVEKILTDDLTGQDSVFIYRAFDEFDMEFGDESNLFKYMLWGVVAGVGVALAIFILLLLI